MSTDIIYFTPLSICSAAIRSHLDADDDIALINNVCNKHFLGLLVVIARTNNGNIIKILQDDESSEVKHEKEDVFIVRTNARVMQGNETNLSEIIPKEYREII